MNIEYRLDGYLKSLVVMLSLVALPVVAMAASNKNIWVSPSGLAREAGATDTIVKTIKDALRLAQPGTTIHIEDGTYEETIIPVANGTAAAPITITAVHPGKVIIEGSRLKDTSGNFIVTGISCGPGKSKIPQYYTISGLRVTHFHSPLQQFCITVGSNWILDNVAADHCDAGGIGIAGDNSVIKNSVVEYNGEQGIGGYLARNTLIEHITSRYNNNGMANPAWKNDTHSVKQGTQYYSNPIWEGGGGKFADMDGCTIKDSEYYGNGGVGLWFDIENKNITITNVNSHDNVPLAYTTASNQASSAAGYGIAVEISPGPITIENSTLSNNSGAGIGIWESDHVTVKNNHFVNNALMLRNLPYRSHDLQNVTATNNRFDATDATKPTGITITDPDNFFQAMSIDMHDNGFAFPDSVFTLTYNRNNKTNVYHYPLQAIQNLGWDSTHPANSLPQYTQQAFLTALGRSSDVYDFLTLVDRNMSRPDTLRAIFSGNQYQSTPVTDVPAISGGPYGWNSVTVESDDELGGCYKISAQAFAYANSHPGTTATAIQNNLRLCFANVVLKRTANKALLNAPRLADCFANEGGGFDYMLLNLNANNAQFATKTYQGARQNYKKCVQNVTH